MRTITVVFTNRMLSIKEMLSHKRYKFLCNYDTISLYDMVEDPRYTSKMLVTGFTNCTNRVQDGITLKDIYITKVNGQAINQPAGLVNGNLAGSNFDIDKQKTSNMEEKRNIKVTLEQAMEWYNSDNSTLRTLALSAYTEDELKLNLKYISNKVYSTCFCIMVPADEAGKYNTLADLAIIAKFFNGSWKKNPINVGYFIEYNEIEEKIDVCAHEEGVYSGVIYFKRKEDAVKAVEILGERVKSLFD